MLTIGSLFAGIGGFDLGLERAGMRSEERDSLREFAEFAIARGVEKNDPFLANKARRALGERP